ncbi:DoxX family protein [Euzebyella saccharophila]|uniref:MauE/DoxX family redox-associated membrane protein n=1 Tax=Euzebyella saccharophila TaxID=679664 RepID=A0ABV8JJ91_9FLAO|nr:MauE/DoxX family redox-associated membrane protein [Euzebyella saccharophila]
MSLYGPWHLYLMATLYILAGILHFLKPKMYKRIIPSYLPGHGFIVVISGIVEIILGLAVFYPPTRNAALYGIIIMLTFFLPVHFFMLNNKKAGMGLPKWALFARIPLQFVLMFWSFWYLNIS